jgi:LysR family transcriptional regulator, low CO2-responsive transcriptional regulator
MEPDIEIGDLRIFLAVAKHLHFTRAGQEVHLSQPTISVRIRQLEEALGVKLFEQTGKKVALTEAGRLFEPYARKVMAALEDSLLAISELNGLERGSLKIGASTTPGLYLVPKVISEFKRRHPGIGIQLSIKNTREVEQEIVKNEFDLGFVGGHLITDEVEVVPWLADDIKLVVPPSHPLAFRKVVRLQDLPRQTFIFREPRSATRAVVDTTLSGLDLKVPTAAELDNPEAVKQAVLAGLGVAFLSTFTARTELESNSLVAVKVRGLNLSRELRIVYRRGKHLGRAARAFIKTAQDLKNQFLGTQERLQRKSRSRSQH